MDGIEGARLGAECSRNAPADVPTLPIVTSFQVPTSVDIAVMPGPAHCSSLHVLYMYDCLHLVDHSWRSQTGCSTDVQLTNDRDKIPRNLGDPDSNTAS